MQDQSPKEKALEIFSEYRFALSVPGSPLGKLKDQIAIKCGYVLCDQAKEAVCQECGKYHDMLFWKDVSVELQKLLENEDPITETAFIEIEGKIYRAELPVWDLLLNISKERDKYKDALIQNGLI